MNKQVEILEIPIFSDFRVVKSYSLERVGNSDTETVVDKVPEIKPIAGKEGKFYKREDIKLKPGDWIIVGLASSPDIDLVDDAILDVEETFGDSIEDFLKNGRIFYEHGYKLAGKTDPSYMYDIPIGIPIAVQIGKNFLYVWSLLDKNHPLAQKVYNALSGDERVSQKLGLSIGAIPFGKGSQKYIDGKVVNIPPKMRLYEISFTGQPVNIATWAQIVKSSVFSMYNVEEVNTLKEDMMPKKEVIKAKEAEEKEKEEEKESTEEEETKNEETKDEGDALTSLLGGGEEGKGEGEGLAGGDSGASLADALMGQGMPGGEMPGMLQGAMPQGMPGEEPAVLADLAPETQGEDAFPDLVLDKLDLLEQKLSKLEEVLSKLNMIEEEEHDMDIDQGKLEEGQKEPEDSLRLGETLKSINDLVEVLTETTQKTLKYVEELHKNLENIEKKVEKSLSEMLTVTKSFNDPKEEEKVVSKAKVGVTKDVHPHMGVATSEKLEEKVKSILASKDKVKKLKSFYEEYINFRGSPVEIQRKKDEIYDKARTTLGLEDYEVDVIFREFKKNFSL
jgi:hypothetical protein